MVDFPLPVGHVISTRPRGIEAIFSAIGPKPISSKEGIKYGITRKAIAGQFFS